MDIILHKLTNNNKKTDINKKNGRSRAVRYNRVKTVKYFHSKLRLSPKKLLMLLVKLIPWRNHIPSILSFLCSPVRNYFGRDIVQSFGLVRTSVLDSRNLFGRIGQIGRTVRTHDDVWRRDLGNRRRSSHHRSRIHDQSVRILCRILFRIRVQILLKCWEITM